ncbi:hypothetical protein HPB48_000272 [Haemaphysalis longicornis]|uniref:Uncharacterized protein n=1 Tax=Haemaphysalis longicornis TaxID=44386 RepID=A0A9J6FQG5_HAELO|nr:hypothetical protein HPB48_000272 [Haemaphysalis longicornis]
MVSYPRPSWNSKAGRSNSRRGTPPTRNRSRAPVVYDGQRDKYVAASGSSLLILPQDANDTTAREKIALSNRVFAVLHQAGDQPLIVLDSGVCATLTELQDGTKSEVSHPTRRLCDDREKLHSRRSRNRRCVDGCSVVRRDDEIRLVASLSRIPPR